MTRLRAFSVFNHRHEAVPFQLVRLPDTVLMQGVVCAATPAWLPRWRRVLHRQLRRPVMWNPGYFFWCDPYHRIVAFNREELRLEPSEGLTVEWQWE